MSNDNSTSFLYQNMCLDMIVDNETKQRPLKLLLAEDTPAIRAMLVKVLQSSNIETMSAKDGAEAFNLFCRHKFDVVLTDIRMPVLNGRLATQFMRIFEASHSDRTPTPIIAISANVSEDDRTRCFAAGVNAFVSKPIDVDELFGKIELLTQGIVEDSLRKPSRSAETCGSDTSEIVFDRDAAMSRLAGDSDLLDQMVGIYRSDQQLLMKDIRFALSNQDLAVASRHAHSLKGLASTIGGVEVAAAAGTLRDCAQAGDLVASNIAFGVLEAANKRLLVELK